MTEGITAHPGSQMNLIKKDKSRITTQEGDYSRIIFNKKRSSKASRQFSPVSMLTAYRVYGILSLAKLEHIFSYQQ